MLKKRIEIKCLLILFLLFTLSTCAFKNVEVYLDKDKARGVYTDKEVNYIVYFGDVNHFIFYVDDPRIKYLIKNIPKGRLHINIADNHYIEKVDQKIKTNLINLVFEEIDASPELIQWAKSNKLHYSDTGSDGYYYSYQVYKPVYLYQANPEVNKFIKEDERKLFMTFSTTLDPQLVKREESPVVIKNNEPYLNDKLLFRLIKAEKIGAREYRRLIYQENVK